MVVDQRLTYSQLEEKLPSVMGRGSPDGFGTEAGDAIIAGVILTAVKVLDAAEWLHDKGARAGAAFSQVLGQLTGMPGVVEHHAPPIERLRSFAKNAGGLFGQTLSEHSHDQPD